MDRVPFKVRINELIEIKGINQTDICEKTGIKKNLISMYVSGDRSPKQDKIDLIAKEFNVNPMWLSGWSDEIQEYKISEKEYSALQGQILAKIAKDKEIMETINTFICLSEEHKKDAIKYIDYLRSQEV